MIKKGGSRIIIVVAVVLILAIGGYFLFSRGDTSESSKNIGAKSNSESASASQRDCKDIEFSEWYLHKFGAKSEGFSCMSKKIRDCETGGVTWIQYGDLEGGDFEEWKLADNVNNEEFRIEVIDSEKDLCVIQFYHFIDNVIVDRFEKYTCKYPKDQLEIGYNQREGANKNNSLSSILFTHQMLTPIHDLGPGDTKQYTNLFNSVEINCTATVDVTCKPGQEHFCP